MARKLGRERRWPEQRGSICGGRVRAGRNRGGRDGGSRGSRDSGRDGCSSSMDGAAFGEDEAK
jgi:hypothetical protein